MSSGYSLTERYQGVHQISSGQIIRANEGIWTIFLQYRLDELRIAGISDSDQVARGPLALGQERFAISSDACIDGRRRVRACKEGNAFCPRFDQVFSGKISGAAIVDSDQVVLAALRIRLEIPIQAAPRECELDRKQRQSCDLPETDWR